MKNRRLHVVFVCVANRVRSVFSEFFFKKMISERGRGLLDQVKVTSAGFIPQVLRDHLTELNISFPEPFYNRPMGGPTGVFLRERGIAVSPDWRSRKLTSAMVREADLIITALPQQKEELLSLYPEAGADILAIREISQWTGYLKSEDFSGLPKDDTYWDYVEENPSYVTAILSEIEESLTRAFPRILSQIGIVE